MNTKRYYSVHATLKQAYRDGDWDYYNTLHREVCLTFNSIHGEEGRPVTIVEDVKMGIVSHIEGNYDSELDAVY